MVRRNKVDVLAELPTKRRAKVRLELSTSEMKKVVAQKQLINDYENRVQVAAQTGELDENDEGWGLPTQEVM